MARKESRGIVSTVFSAIGQLFMFLVRLVVGLVKLLWGLVAGLLLRDRSNQTTRQQATAQDALAAGTSERPRDTESVSDSTSREGDEVQTSTSQRSSIPVVPIVGIVAAIALIAFATRPAAEATGGAARKEAPAVEEQAAVTQEQAEVDLVFSKVAYSVAYAEEDGVACPQIKLTATVTNSTSNDLSSRYLPSLSYGYGQVPLELADGRPSFLEPQKEYAVTLEQVFLADAPAYEFSFEEEGGTEFTGLDSAARGLTSAFARCVKGLAEEQARLDAKKHEEQNRPFVFSDVDWRVENAEADGAMRTIVSLKAKVANNSTIRHEPDDFPSLSYGDRSERLVKTGVDASGTADVDISLSFDGTATPYEFKFRSEKGKPSFEGLDGVAEAITKAFAERIAALPQEQADLQARLDAERQAREEEEERQRQEQAEEEERRRQEQEAERERLRQEQEAAAEQQRQNRTVWVLGDNPTYHTKPNCQHIRGKGATAMSLQEALDRGCSLCGSCR